MAVLDAPSFKDPAVVIGGPGLIVLSYLYTFGAVLAAADYIRYFKLPKGARLAPGGWFIETAADLDTSTNLTLSLQVTDLTTTKTIISASTLGQGAAGIVQEIDAAGNGAGQLAWRAYVTTSDDFFVRLLVAAGPSTAATGTIHVGCSYTMSAVGGDIVTP